MKILIAVDMSARKIGSLERSLFCVTKLLKEKNFTVKCLFSGIVSEEVIDYFKLDRNDIVENLGEFRDPQSKNLWLQQFRSENPDVLWLHFFPLHGQFLWNIRNTCKNAKICSSERVSRGYPEPNIIKDIIKVIRQIIYGHCIDHHIAVSDFILRRLHDVDKVSADKISLVYNGIDTEDFFPNDLSTKSINPNERKIFSAGYLREEKGIDVLLEAITILKKRGITPVFEIVGDGPKLEDYRSIIIKNKLTNVNFVGLKNDMPMRLRDAYLTVVPSLWPEAFCNVAAESLSSGVPVIATDVGGLPEVVSHNDTGLVVSPGDPEALADSIRNLLDNPELRERMSVAAREFCIRQFNLKTQSEKIVAILTADSR